MAIQHLFGVVGASNFRGSTLNLLESAGSPFTQIGANAVADPIPATSHTDGSPWPLLAQNLFDDYGIRSDFRSRSVGGTGMVDHIDNGKSSTALVNIVSDLATLEASYVGGGDTVRKYVWINFSNQDHNSTKAIDRASARQRYRDCMEYAFENGCGYVIAGQNAPRPDLTNIDSDWHDEVGIPLLKELAEEYRFDNSVLILTDLSLRLGQSDSAQGGMFTDNIHYSVGMCNGIAKRWAFDLAQQLIPQGV